MIEPEVCVPSASGTCRSATAAAEPLDEPPGVWLVAPTGHPVTERAEQPQGVAFAEIVSNDFVGLADGSALHEHLARHAEQLGKRLKYRVRLRSFDAICQMVERRVGISILPERTAERWRKAFGIRVVALTDEWASRELRICLRSFDDLPAYGKRLVEALVNER
jgi:DNA-binding transcriptional LysR family regulator